MMNKNQN